MADHLVEEFRKNSQLFIDRGWKVFVVWWFFNSASHHLPQVLIATWHEKSDKLKSADFAEFGLVKPWKSIGDEFLVVLTHEPGEIIENQETFVVVV